MARRKTRVNALTARPDVESVGTPPNRQPSQPLRITEQRLVADAPEDSAASLLRGDVGVADHLAPELGLLGEEADRLGTRAADRLHLHLTQPRVDVWPADHFGDVAVEAIGERLRRIRRRHQ